MINTKKSTRKRISLYHKDKWDIPSGNTRKGERAYRKEHESGSSGE